jgi:hypothetical protein
MKERIRCKKKNSVNRREIILWYLNETNRMSTFVFYPYVDVYQWSCTSILGYNLRLDSCNRAGDPARLGAWLRVWSRTWAGTVISDISTTQTLTWKRWICSIVVLEKAFMYISTIITFHPLPLLSIPVASETSERMYFKRN